MQIFSDFSENMKNFKKIKNKSKRWNFGF